MTRVQDDLFATVNADWLKEAQIPADKPRISAFDELVLKNEKNLAHDLTELSKNLPTDNPELLEAIKFYNKAGDWEKRRDPVAEKISINAKLHAGEIYREFAKDSGARRRESTFDLCHGYRKDLCIGICYA